MRYFIPDVALIGNGFIVESRADGENTIIPDNIQYVSTGGYYEVGDGGGAFFKKVVGPLSDGASFQSGDGAWWELSETTINPRMFGAKGDITTDDTIAINNSFAHSCLNWELSEGDY